MPPVLYRMNASGQWVAPGRDPFVKREVLAYGTYRPQVGVNAGVLNEDDLELHSGDLITSAPNQVFRNLRITGRTKIRHDNYTFINCLHEGGTPSGSGFGTVEAFQARTVGGRFYDCTFRASVQTKESTNAIQGRDFELHRCVLEGSGDGAGLQYSNAHIYGSVIRNVRWYIDGWFGGTPSHSDGVQIHGGHDFSLVGCSIEMGEPGLPPGEAHNAAIMLTQDVAATSNILIDRNWIYSLGTGWCQVGINLSQTGTFGSAPYGGFVTITGNRFSPASTWTTGRAGLIDGGTKAIATISGNVWDATGLPATI